MAALSEFVNDGVLLNASESVSTPSATASNSKVVDARKLKRITFYFQNTSDKSVTFQVQAAQSAAFSSAFNLPNAVVSLAAGNSTTQSSCAVLSDLHPFLRVSIVASGTSTVGAALVAVSAQE